MIVKSRYAPRQKKTRITRGRTAAAGTHSQPLCLIQSPNGAQVCALPKGHADKFHQAHCTVVKWVQLVESEAEQLGAKAGEWVTVDVLPRGEQHVVVALWPRRDDDIAPSGAVTQRQTDWLRQRAKDEDCVLATALRKRPATLGNLPAM